MNIEILVAEIGSTTTVVNAFSDIDTNPSFVGQGQASTTVLEGDVNIGIENAIGDLKKNLNIDELNYKHLIASSSAAGGLKMTVHGLVYDMTVKAAKEAALGAGANLKFLTGGKLRKSDIKKIQGIRPNIILLAGGVDYGERETALYNAELIADLDFNVPVIYAGNIENREEIKEIFADSNKELYIVDNVYPSIDELNVEPTRKVIQDVFEKHIIHAPGMESVRDMVDGSIMPTPGAVMQATKLLYNKIGDLMTIDVGGATTDVHSVTEDSDEISRILLSPEPTAKRTVEGDLGCYVSFQNVVDIIGKENLSKKMKVDISEIEDLIENIKPIPEEDIEIRFVEELAESCTVNAVLRHVGRLKDFYGPSGKKTYAEGKDLTQIKYIIGTGGALTRLPNRVKILENIALSGTGVELLPNKETRILIDTDYIMASLGVLSLDFPEIAIKLLEKSLKL
ncbi:MAG: DNA mismatch repair protein MutL [Tissierellia bacterium]|nr:DNA mismatch repair protein MutL [Tissierellia bacterium]